MRDAVRIADRLVWRDGALTEGHRRVPEETAVALTYNGGTQAVMMATPQDLSDFAVGFSLNEGLITGRDDIISLDVVELDDGIELRMWLPDALAERLAERRRNIAGPTGCGLCGIDSLAEAVRPAAHVPQGRRFTPRDVMTALAAIEPLQKLNHETRAVHAAAFWTPARGIVALREDVGRHNALDKLAGHLAQAHSAATEGLVIMTSRVSVELVQKAAAMGAPVLVAVSAPTALAIRMAEAAGITLIAVARNDGFEIFTHPERIVASAETGTRSTQTDTPHVA
ncbi:MULTISPECIES: formate dehydrogenase accessory sulfurtransferase FdhD [unclassified Bradyrhizobium]|uniref:formate dehydrogenase accessory sulfurtransferase FdhD n=1 Tax=unclassified Bradyrhizobium TaxID=2631580 RepID=UPI0028EAA643|nr:MULTISPECIES: formate dehydrogenase accessory sulfurtransferase FdhD [unclassified Bradyrhizobium]